MNANTRRIIRVHSRFTVNWLTRREFERLNLHNLHCKKFRILFFTSARGFFFVGLRPAALAWGFSLLRNPDSPGRTAPGWIDKHGLGPSSLRILILKLIKGNQLEPVLG
jgi:hypothetical protein